MISREFEWKWRKTGEELVLTIKQDNMIVSPEMILPPKVQRKEYQLSGPGGILLGTEALTHPALDKKIIQIWPQISCSHRVYLLLVFELKLLIQKVVWVKINQIS